MTPSRRSGVLTFAIGSSVCVLRRRSVAASTNRYSGSGYCNVGCIAEEVGFQRGEDFGEVRRRIICNSASVRAEGKERRREGRGRKKGEEKKKREEKDRRRREETSMRD